ncbi:hypothetical protein M0R45_010251 [Rubus argutus]|uniref:Uncharacterized protein n=1 Tax=Rubus argutus TaxID=59490 RepID=A0AAW1Y6T3_RUBAR
MPALKAITTSWTSITMVRMPRPGLAENGREAEWSKVGMEAVELGLAGSTSVGGVRGGEEEERGRRRGGRRVPERRKESRRRGGDRRPWV